MAERDRRRGLTEDLRRSKDLQRDQLNRARAQVVTMVTSFAGRPPEAMSFDVDVVVEPTNFRSKTTVTFGLDVRDYPSIPSSFQGVFADLGLTFEDDVNLVFSVQHGTDDFDVTVLPRKVTDNKYGIRLSTEIGRGALIVPDPDLPNQVVEVPFHGAAYGGKKRNRQLLAKLTKGKGASLLLDYNLMSGKLIDALPARNQHPLLINAVEGAAMWTPHLLQNRRKPEFQTS